jgi:hypothetical protein
MLTSSAFTTLAIRPIKNSIDATRFFIVSPCYRFLNSLIGSKLAVHEKINVLTLKPGASLYNPLNPALIAYRAAYLCSCIGVKQFT